jgi:hypothetical protein
MCTVFLKPSLGFSEDLANTNNLKRILITYALSNAYLNQREFAWQY